MATFSTAYLDQTLAKQRSQLEAERQHLLSKVMDWLDQFGPQYGIKEAYVFGSLTCSNQFTHRSDIDIAVETINWEDFFSIIGWLSEATGREVDLIPLEKCHFANRVRERGIKWTQKS